ncbi:MAG: ribosome assembly RNA-binding protein YhbY [Steroidobacteraceae bacterium]|jgi:RNA-binding protein|nr:ribosome assembly RNA-binding protein YhbY [Steroidobacteraceae bacterium]MCC7200793.1 ribosome assembly RNA-binding protein YhbY [Gammaproteobacteria bacterium]
MELSDNQKKYLRGLGHPLKPLVMVGQHGLTDAVIKELDQTLDAHELVKVRARVGDRDVRDEALAAMAERTGAVLVQKIGNVGLLYRANRKLPRIVLPGA